MTYHVLARKWRPQTFSDLVGQTHVIKALTFALSQNQVHHAYLFTGTRGVGKTSIARILAKSLNCQVNGVSANPCCQCESCLEIKAGKFIDLIEVDAASRTGVDETRELIDSVAYLPTKGRYKVYLIDEVHMFSKSSFNALLKTLEEPPEHVKFILATTDPEKLPNTILSRCLQFTLKSLSTSQVRQHLANICQAESIRYDGEALMLLANAGDGSMRDTLSMTDQAIAFGQGELSTAAVTEILGTIHPADIEAILFAIATNNPNQLSDALHRLDHYEVDARAFLIDVMKRLQRMAWAKEGIAQQLSPALLSTVSDIPKALLHLWYDIAEKALPNLSVSGESRNAIEMALLRMLAFTPSDWLPRHRTVLDNDFSTQASEESHEKLSEVSASLSVTENQVADTHATVAMNSMPAQSTIAAQPTVAVKETTEMTAENHQDTVNDGLVMQVQATPIVQSDDLVAAEVQFGQDFIHQSPIKTTGLASPDNVQSQQVLPETPLETVDGLQEKAIHQETVEASWHLSESVVDKEKPSLSTVHAIMQRGSDISSPKVIRVEENAPSITSEKPIEDVPPWQS
ncbi:MAG: DNA polymerase III subunit gamma/tau, partial [Ostreibacterium sp.]